MAGDWIKLRCDLRSDPAVFKLAELTSLDRFSVVGRLAEFWSWIDKHAVDGRVDGGTSTAIDDVVAHVGFAEALQQVHWLCVDAAGVYIPKHEHHNGESAKDRNLKSERQARWRAKRAAELASKHVDGHVDATPSTREEKRREEKNTPVVTKGTSSSSKRKRAKAPLSADLPTWMQSLVSLYHEVLPELPACRVMDKDRQQAMVDFRDWVLHSHRPDGSARATNDEEVLVWTRDYFTRARSNDFIMGRGPRSPEHKNWRCSIEYLLSSRGMKKVIEETAEAAA